MKKILLFGPEVTDFLNPLAGKLKDIGYTVDLLENRKIPRNNDTITNSYSAILNYHKIVGKKITFTEILKYMFKMDFIKDYYKEIFINCLEGKCKILKSFKITINRQLLNDRFSKVLNSYDIINFHSLSPGMLSFAKYINPDKKIILSFWGSDLYQINGIKNYYEQFEALGKADLITVQSYEMQLVVLSKFGSAVKGNIVRALFGINDSVFDRLDVIMNSGIDQNFLKNYAIPENKIKVTICYCGNPVCNHIPIINELEKIDSETKSKIHLMVPMTYGHFSQEYFDEVKFKLDKIKITYTLLKEYLPYEDVLKMRAYSNIMIMMNKSDALSQSVSEFLYAENLLISAAWLPYSPFRLQGVFMSESDFPGLSAMVSNAVINYQSLKANLKDNPQKVKSFTAFSKIWKPWADLLESLN